MSRRFCAHSDARSTPLRRTPRSTCPPSRPSRPARATSAAPAPAPCARTRASTPPAPPSPAFVEGTTACTAISRDDARARAREPSQRRRQVRSIARAHPSVAVVPRDVRFRTRRRARVDDTSQRWATFRTHRPELLGQARIPQEISDRAPRPRTLEQPRTPPSIPAMDPRPDSSFIVTLPQNTPRRTPSECAAP